VRWILFYYDITRYKLVIHIVYTYSANFVVAFGVFCVSILLILLIIKTLFQEATDLTTLQSSVRASNNRKQLTNN